MLGSTRQHPVIIGIVGDSAAGKTTMAAGLAEVLGAERTVNICIDDYHRYDRAERSRRGITPTIPPPTTWTCSNSTSICCARGSRS